MCFPLLRVSGKAERPRGQVLKSTGLRAFEFRHPISPLTTAVILREQASLLVPLGGDRGAVTGTGISSHAMLTSFQPQTPRCTVNRN